MDALKEHILSNNKKKYQWKKLIFPSLKRTVLLSMRCFTRQVAQVIRQERSIARPDAMAVMQITKHVM